MGSLAGVMGHAVKVRQSLFEWFGAKQLQELHVSMGVVVLVLFTIGYAALATWLYLRHIRPQTRSELRWGGASALILGFATLATLSAIAATPEPPDVRNLLRKEADQWSTELLSQQNADGGLRWSKVDRTVESQVWSTAQVLTGVLTQDGPMSDEATRRVRRAFDFIQHAALPDAGEGWGYFEYVPWGVTEINAWVAVALARSITHTDQARIWPDGEVGAKARLRVAAKLITDRVMTNGGWTPISLHDNLRFGRTYSTLMSTWALLEIKSALKTTDYDEHIKGGISWLITTYNPAWGGWVPNPDRSVQNDGFPGLTAHVIFVLSRALPVFESTLNQSRFGSIAGSFRQWLDGELVPLKRSNLYSRPVGRNDRAHDSDRYLPRSKYMVESSTFLWYPWSLSACTSLASVDAATWSAKCKRLGGRINELVKFAKEEPFTYVTAESLFAVNHYLSSRIEPALAKSEPR